MGIVNRTPDSFYDGGRYLDDEAARRLVVRLVDEGADIVDIGAESSRPSAPPVPAGEQIARLCGLIDFAVTRAPVVSVDTTRPEVAAWALRRGASMINSVSLAPAAALGSLCSSHHARLVLTHCRGSMADMEGFSVYAVDGYQDVVVDVSREWQQAASLALRAGLAPGSLVFDPGLGFTKNGEQSLELCARLAEFVPLGHDILVGTSRKSYLASAVAHELGGAEPPPADWLGASLTAAVECVSRGATIVRVHEVAATRQALAYRAALDERSHTAPSVGGGPSRPARIGGYGA